MKRFKLRRFKMIQCLKMRRIKLGCIKMRKFPKVLKNSACENLPIRRFYGLTF